MYRLDLYRSDLVILEIRTYKFQLNSEKQEMRKLFISNYSRYNGKIEF